MLTTSLMAWGPIGHMAVANMAYQELTPNTKARVRDLLKLNPEYADWEKQIPAGTSPEDHDRMIFMIASTWADDIKGDSKYSDDGPDPNTPDGATSSQNIGYTDRFRHRYWHFVDVPFSADHTALPPIPAPNAQTQIAAFRAVLGSAQSDELKSYDLVWLLHLIGDVHQPLHATTRITQTEPKGDAGGNNVKLSGDGSSNLHSHWDDIPGLDCNFCKNKIHCIDRAVVFSRQLKASSVKAVLKTDTTVWIQESFTAARTVVYRVPIGAGSGPYTIVPQSAYDLAAYRLAQKRITLAGARLAEVLNHELK
jgi:S1/P1 Nuclease